MLDEVSARCVHPNRVCVPMAPAGVADPEAARAFRPAGVLYARVHRASGLPRKGAEREKQYEKLRFHSKNKIK